MADIFDLATEREEMDRELSLKNRRPNGPPATGYCLFCGPDVPLEDGRRWCSAECRDDWTRINGK